MKEIYEVLQMHFMSISEKIYFCADIEGMKISYFALRSWDFLEPQGGSLFTVFKGMVKHLKM